MRSPSANDIIVGDGGNTTVYRRPDGSEYALDREGRGGEGRTKVYGPARFDSRSKFSGGDAVGAGGALGLILLIVFPLAIFAGLCWVLYHAFKWLFEQPIKTRVVILGVFLALAGAGIGIGAHQASVAAAARHREALVTEHETANQEEEAKVAGEKQQQKEAKEQRAKQTEEDQQVKQEKEGERQRKTEEEYADKEQARKIRERRETAAKEKQASTERQEARMAKERTEESTAPGSMNKYPGETCVGPGEQEYKCSAAQKSESSPASRALGR